MNEIFGSLRISDYTSTERKFISVQFWLDLYEKKKVSFDLLNSLRLYHNTLNSS